MIRKFLIPTIFLLLLAARFAGLETSPPGFYVDEAAGAAHVLCFAKDKVNAHGESWPLWSPSLGSGFTTPVFLYLQTGWTRIFGDSPAGFRSFSALAGVITIAATMLIAGYFAGREALLWTLLAGLVSPWGFHMSRIAWDPPLAPMFLMAGIAVLLLCRHRRGAVISGILLSLSMYCYPPFYVQTSLILALLIIFRKRLRIEAPRQVYLLSAFALAIVPVMIQMRDSRFLTRASAICLWSDLPVNPVAGKGPVAHVGQFAKNILSHLDPGFLLIHGDKNLRHSSQFGGVLSWFDAAVIVGLFLIIAYSVCRRKSFPSAMGFPVAFAALGWLTALVAASLTWESIPHALRSIGGWPFVVLLTGLGAHHIAALQKRTVPVLAGIALVFAVLFLRNYFFEYPEKSASWFDAQIKTMAMQGQKPDNYPDLAWTYFRMEYPKK